MTTRDNIWTAALDLASKRRFTTADVAKHPVVGDNGGASARTIRETLHAITDAGHLDHRDGEHYYYPPETGDPTHTALRGRQPHRWTFEDDVIRAWVEARLEGRTLNLFAGETMLDHPEGAEIVRNDENPDRPAEYHFDAAEVADHFPADSFDTVLLDPPWGEGVVHRRTTLYGGHVVDEWTRVRDGVATVLRPSGRSIRLGYDTSGLGAKRGARVEATLAINFRGRQRDVGAVVERLGDNETEDGRGDV